jgi:hypothetical protein
MQGGTSSREAVCGRQSQCTVGARREEGVGEADRALPALQTCSQNTSHAARRTLPLQCFSISTSLRTRASQSLHKAHLLASHAHARRALFRRTLTRCC